MAEEHHKIHDSEIPTTVAVESTDRGMFDFLRKKKEEKPQEEEVDIVNEFEKVQVSEPKEKKEEYEEEKKPTLVEKLHRSDSSSSSSSEEEEGEGGEKKKKKKGLKEKISSEKEEEKKVEACEKKEEEEKKVEPEETFVEGTYVPVPVEKCDQVLQEDTTHPEEKKGFLEKIKEKLPGHQKKTEEGIATSPQAECGAEGHAHEGEGETKEKKGILEKIKEKLPGYHKTGEEKEKEKESSTY